MHSFSFDPCISSGGNIKDVTQDEKDDWLCLRNMYGMWRNSTILHYLVSQFLSSKLKFHIL